MRTLPLLRVGILALLLGAASCRGPEGPAGPPGDPGDPGPGGESCWDLDASGTCDTVTEDLNGDGACDALDCTGSPGDDCWDLDGNGSCEVATEDIDMDGSCTVLDCAGVSTGAIAGTVTDADTGAAVAGVTVTLSPAAAMGTTGATGAYLFTVPLGVYAVEFTAAGLMLKSPCAA